MANGTGTESASHPMFLPEYDCDRREDLDVDIEDIANKYLLHFIILLGQSPEVHLFPAILPTGSRHQAGNGINL